MYLRNSKQFKEWEKEQFCKRQECLVFIRLNCELKTGPGA